MGEFTIRNVLDNPEDYLVTYQEPWEGCTTDLKTADVCVTLTMSAADAIKYRRNIMIKIHDDLTKRTDEELLMDYVSVHRATIKKVAE